MSQFRDQPDNRARGRVGEEDAVRWLVEHGYGIVARNVVNKGGEIDVVAMDGATICFLEVKARDGVRYGPAIEAVTAGKQRRISRAAALFLSARGWHGRPCRFDVLGLDRDGGLWRYTLVKNAFPYQPGPVRRRW